MTFRTTIEIVPFGDESAKRTIVTINASLEEIQGAGTGKYTVSVTTDGKLYPLAWTFHVWHPRVAGAVSLLMCICQYMEAHYEEANAAIGRGHQVIREDHDERDGGEKEIRDTDT